MITKEHKDLIQKVINIFETGKIEGKYDALVVYNDGKDNSSQITYGRSQTTEQSNLKTLIAMYIDNDGKYSNQFKPYLDKIGTITLSSNEDFKYHLILAAKDDVIMRETQDQFFDALYWLPALQWFYYHKCSLPLTMLVTYDSYIHSGGVPMFLRERFKETMPDKQGDEKLWTPAYVKARHRWLGNHEKKLLRNTIYRTRLFLNEIDRDNWYLDKLPINVNGITIS